MKGFREYQSKPITRLAYRVPEGMVAVQVGEATFRIFVDGKKVLFKAYEPVKAGDYIVYLDDKDIYHCRAEVFAERNVVEGTE